MVRDRMKLRVDNLRRFSGTVAKGVAKRAWRVATDFWFLLSLEKGIYGYIRVCSCIFKKMRAAEPITEWR